MAYLTVFIFLFLHINLGRSCGAIKQYKDIFLMVVKPTIRHGIGMGTVRLGLPVLITDNQKKIKSRKSRYYQQNKNKRQ